MKNILLSASVVFGALLLSSCSKDDIVTDPLPDLVIPETYDSTAFSTNAVAELDLLGRLTAISNEMKKGRNNGTIVEYSVLSALLNEGTPSLKSVGSPYYLSKIDGAGGWLEELAKASGGTYTPGEPTGEGGTFGPEDGTKYLFDENGVELEQLVEKGMFGAVLYKHANDLLNGTIDATTADKVLAIFGAHPSFPNSNDGSKHANPDKFIANYTARRDKNEAENPGFYLQIKNALIKLQAAGKAGDKYAKDQQDAAAAIRENWEKANAATIINYAYSIVGKLSNTTPTEADQASAIHSVAECIGFVQGLKTVSGKKITDTQIDEILTLLNAPAEGTPTVYKFATDGPTELPKIQEIISKLQTIYGFTAGDLEDFKQNWVSVQQR